MSTPLPAVSPDSAASLADYLRVVAPRFDGPLFSAASRTKLRFLAGALPPVSKTILECRLTDDADQVDLSVAIPRAPLPLSATLRRDPAWREFEALGAEWVDPRSTIHRFVRDIWIELDGAGAMPPMPAPNLFFALDWEAGARAHLPAIAATLLRRPLSPELARSLQLADDAVFGEVRLAHLGAMLARGTDALRLVISRAPGAQIPNHLEKLGWDDRGGRLRETMARLPQLVDEFYFDFDLHDGIGPRVFVECFVKQPLHRKERWQRFFDYLGTLGLCSAAKAGAVLAWRGVARKPAAPDAFWPPSLRWGDELLQHLATSAFVCDVSHVKLAFEAGELLEAKVYLSLEHGWFDRRKLLELFQQGTARAAAADQEKKNV